jgi:alpha-mannosidase
MRRRFAAHMKLFSRLNRLFPCVLLVAAVATAAPAQPASSRDTTVNRLTSITVLQLPEWKWHPDDGTLARPESAALDDSSWPTFKVGSEWSSGPVWFRRVVEVPAKIGGYDAAGATIRLRVRIYGENPVVLAVYFDGAKIAEGNDIDPVVLTDRAQPGKKILVAVRANVPGGRTEFRAGQLELQANSRPDPRRLLLEFLSAEAIVKTHPASGREQALDRTAAALDWAALDRGDQAGFDRSIEKSRAALGELRPWLKTFSIRATGNSHIDLSWLWPQSEAVEIVRNTWTTVLQLMREFPDFTFTASSAAAYEWMEEKYPTLFAQIQQRVKEGRWEPIGGMWVEPDLNIPSGESLVRQLLTGTRYFHDKFGVEIKTGWNPDSFGYNWQLPQIYKKSGMDYFVTQKIYWNEVTKFPYKLFWWESPDGSRVLTYFPHDYGNPIDPVRMAEDVSVYEPAMHSPELMHLYGVGDHGGGPTRSMLENAEQWKRDDSIYPKLFLGTAQPFFDELGRKAPQMQIPTWNSELYLEYHRGAYTSQADTKRNNRHNEVLLLNAEKFASVASLWGKPYPQQELNYAWHKVLFNQFHDIMAGSSIAAVYRDADRDYAEARRIAQESTDASLSAIAARADTNGPGIAIVVYNPLSWPRSESAEISLPGSFDRATVQDSRGGQVLSQVVSRDPASHRVTLQFLATDVPAVGFAVFHALPPAGGGVVAMKIHTSGLTMENESVRVVVDKNSGCITSLVDKRGGGEVLAQGACGNLLQAFHDLPHNYDAWNIDANFEDQKWDLNKAESVELTETGPLRAVIRVTKKFQHSTFVQDLTLAANSPRVDVRTAVDWHEKHVLIKAAFPLSVRSDFATYEIPFGSIQRPTTRNTPAEKARFEVPAQRWADLSDERHGLSILNESKYGYDGKDNVLRITLLRSPAYPDPHADEGHHEFTYSLYPHAGTWNTASTTQRGYELNYPLIAKVELAHVGPLGPEHSFVQLEPGNLILTAVKKAEDDDGLVLRFYEWAGKASTAKLLLPEGATRAVETNLMEKEQGPLAIEQGSVSMPVKPYEIKALKVTFAPRR